SKALTLKDAILRFGREKRNGPVSAGRRRMVFTNGCFDLLHPGHIRGFELARQMGDALIVGLNSDASVRQLKGPTRPVIPEQERAEILSALESVDAVVIFDELTPREVISQLLPDVLVKGGDWPGDQIVGREEVEAAGGRVVSITGLHDVAKALSAVYITHALRRPAFFVTDSNRRAESLAETLRFFAAIFPGASGSVATLPSFDRLPWESQSPHADILERRATTLFRLADGQISLVIAPMAALLWRYQDPAAYLYLTKTLAKDTEIGHEELVRHLGSVGYTRTEMVELPGQFAVRGGIIDVFSPEVPRPVRIELLGDTVESVREFDARTQRSIAPVVRTTLLPLTEWAVPPLEKVIERDSMNWESVSAFGPGGEPGAASLFELSEGSLRPIVFLDEPQRWREAAQHHLAAATEVYERHGHANSPDPFHYFWSEEQIATALGKTSQIHLEQL